MGEMTDSPDPRYSSDPRYRWYVVVYQAEASDLVDFYVMEGVDSSRVHAMFSIPRTTDIEGPLEVDPDQYQLVQPHVPFDLLKEKFVVQVELIDDEYGAARGANE